MAALQEGKGLRPVPSRLPFPQFSNPAILQFSKHLLFFVVQARVVQEIRAPIQRPDQRFTLPPAPYLRVVPRQQHVGDLQHTLG